MTLLLTMVILLALPGCNSETQADTSLDSGRAFIHYGGMGDVCATEDTVYFTSGHLVHYYEKATGISGILCGKAECEHSTASGSSCNAYIGSRSEELQLYNGRLYWIQRGSGLQICSMALDGTDHRTDRTVERGFFASNLGNWSAIIHRGAAYIWTEEYTITNGKEAMSLDMAVVPLDSDEEPYMIFQDEMSDMATMYRPNVTMQGYQDDIYLITSAAAGNYESDPDGSPDFYDLQIRRYNAVTGELTTLYRDNESPIDYTVEMWAMDDGIIFFGGQNEEDTYSFHTYRLDFESGEISALVDFDYGNVQIADDLVICSRWYDQKKTNPTNPWGFALTMQDIEVSGKLRVVIQNFAGDTLADETYSLEGYYGYPCFYGCDDTCAYFLDYKGLNGASFTSLIGVALDGSGMEVLCMEEEFYESGSSGHDKTIITQDDGTQIILENGETITIIPGDGGETVAITVEELLEKGYQP